jgi:endonuclease/exonuclease/phosphatase family metal-dependent hydrolase
MKRTTRGASVSRHALRAAILLAAAGCEPLWTTWDERAPVRVEAEPGAAAPTPPPGGRLKVMAWNVKYAGGRIDFWFDLWGDRVQMTRAEVDGNLTGLIALINEVQPDVLLTEEIEVNARRSAYVNMVREILARTSLAYAAYVPTWRSRYIASEGLGRMDLGNAIFSRFPIKRAERIPQSDRTDQDPATAAFYIHRAIGRAVLDLGGREVAALVVHTEAYDTDGTKSRQLREIEEVLREERLPFVVGGDFNAIPPGSVRAVDFNDEHPDSRGTDFAQPPYDLDDMTPFYAEYVSAIARDRYGATLETQRRHFTHSVIGPDRVGARGEPGFWNRTLDYLFVKAPSSWQEGSTDTLQEPGRLGIGSDPLLLSDHCPVVGVWQVAP